MHGLPKKITCTKCMMSLRVEAPPRAVGERSRCPDCKRPFWHYDHNTYKDPGRAHIRVGILPQWLWEWASELQA